MFVLFRLFLVERTEFYSRSPRESSSVLNTSQPLVFGFDSLNVSKTNTFQATILMK